MTPRAPAIRLLVSTLLVLAGLTGVIVLAFVGWDLRQGQLILGSGEDFVLSKKEWSSVLRECLVFGFGALVVCVAVAYLASRRTGVSMGRSFVRLLGSLAVGWAAALYALGRLAPIETELMEIAWIGVAASAAAVCAFRARSDLSGIDRNGENASAGESRSVSAQWGKLALVLVVVYAATFGAISVMRHNAFGTDLHDLGLYDQMLWNTLRGRPFHCTLWQITPGPGLAGGYDLKRFDYNFLAEHLMPVLLLLTPVYALWQDPRTLLILQSIALAMAGFVLYRLAARTLGSRALACLIAFGFLMNPLVQQTNVKDFHADAFEPLFFFLAIAALAERRIWLYWPALVLLLSCKEDVSLTVMALGVFLLWRERRIRLGLGTVVLGVAWYAIGVHVVMGHFRDGEPLRQLYRYSHLVAGETESVSGILQTFLLNPLYVAQIALEPARIESFLRLFIPVAFLPFIAPSALLFVLPPLASNLLSNWDTQYSLGLHYSIAIMGPLYVAAVFGARNWLVPDSARQPFFAKADEAGEDEAPVVGRLLRRRAAALVAFLFVAIVLFGYRYGRFPGGDRFDAADLRVTEHNRLAYRYIAALNRDDAISAHSAIGAHITGRKTIYVFPEIQDASVILVDTRDHNWPMTSRQAYEERVRALIQSGDWGVIRDYEDGFLLMKRGADTARNAEVLGKLNFTTYR